MIEYLSDERRYKATIGDEVWLFNPDPKTLPDGTTESQWMKIAAAPSPEPASVEEVMRLADGYVLQHVDELDDHPIVQDARTALRAAVERLAQPSKPKNVSVHDVAEFYKEEEEAQPLAVPDHWQEKAKQIVSMADTLNLVDKAEAGRLAVMLLRVLLIETKKGQPLEDEPAGWAFRYRGRWGQVDWSAWTAILGPVKEPIIEHAEVESYPLYRKRK